jgi:hypothetical protein
MAEVLSIIKTYNGMKYIKSLFSDIALLVVQNYDILGKENK